MIRWKWGNLPQSDMSKIYRVIFGLSIYQNVSLDGKKIIIQLPQGDDATHACLNSFKDITNAEAKAMAASPEFCKEP